MSVLKLEDWRIMENNKIDLLDSGFYYNRLTGSIELNYDIFPLIRDFDFYSFIDYAEKHKNVISDYGGFIVITPKQYIIGYNSNFGTGTHFSSFARVTKEIYGGGSIQSSKEAKSLVNYCLDNFIVGSIIYECIEEYGVPKCSGYISFDIKNKKISLEEFHSFEMFYNGYNAEIRRVISKYGIDKFNVVINIKNDSKIERIVSDCLDELYIYLKSCIDYDIYDDYYDEIVIGKENVNKILKLY